MLNNNWRGKGYPSSKTGNDQFRSYLKKKISAAYSKPIATHAYLLLICAYLLRDKETSSKPYLAVSRFGGVTELPR